MSRPGPPALYQAFLAVVSLLLPTVVFAQAPPARARITQPINESNLVTLKGNTHPLARPEFDRGPAPDSQPMTRALLLLQRSPDQEAALRQLLDQQQSSSSPNFHQWLTPAQFGQQFGPSDADIATVTTWLQSHGFSINRISAGRTVIEISGTAGQIRNAFRTEIHSYVVNGESHWANSTDPEIPAALAPVVAGFASLHNFYKKPMYHVAGVFSKSVSAVGSPSLGPGYTFTCLNPYSGVSQSCSPVTPYDFATIYNVLPLWNAASPIDGTGQVIALVARTNINVQDVADFRALFGLPPNPPQIILNGPDPGILLGDETESDLDVEWSGAVAKGATIKLVVSQPTETTDGVDLSALYIVDNNIAPVMSASYGQCELNLGSAENQFINNLWQQAAAQGITVFVSTGDNGSAGCDFNDQPPPDPAENGLQVSGLASTPYNVAVGGTDFDDLFNPATYWNSTSDPVTLESALGYIPETTWNQTCTNAIFGDPRVGQAMFGNSEFMFSTDPNVNCNNLSTLSVFVDKIGGSGGASNCTTATGSTPATCAGGYSKPVWQSAPGVPQDGSRDIPDVSLFASAGFMHNFYMMCEADNESYNFGPNDFGPCGTDHFLGIGGTSASSPTFAGIMALVNQKTQSRQGNANYVFYRLAASQSASSCNSSTGPASACVFNDVTSGTIAMPCATGSLNCVTETGQIGILSGYRAGSGYDQATGLGSVNAANLVNDWPTVTLIGSNTALTFNNNSTASISHGASVPVAFSVSPSTGSGTPTGDVSLVGTLSGGNTLGFGEFTLGSNGTVSGSTTSLAGGTYTLTAHYAGDAVYAPSNSTGVSITVTPEASKVLVSIPTFNPNTGSETGNSPSSLVYGSPYLARIDVGNAPAKLTYPPQQVCTPPTCPTGTITWTDSLNGGAPVPLDGGSFTLNSEGFTEDQPIQLGGGSHVLTAGYSGDSSYSASVGTYSLAVEPMGDQIQPLLIAFSPIVIGVPFNIVTSVSADSLGVGAAPTGTIAFYDGSTQIQGTVSYNAIAGSNAGAATLNATLTGAVFATSGTHSITAKYSGDPDYLPATSPPLNEAVVWPTTIAETESSTNVNYGQSITVTAKATGNSKGPGLTGQFTFLVDGSAIAGQVTLASSTDANGNPVLTGTITTTPQDTEEIQVNYIGDPNYAYATTQNLITVNIPDFSLGTANGLNLIPVAGQAASLQVTITPLSQTPSTVNLSLSPPVQTIAGYAISLSPTQVSLNGAAATATISLTPNGSPAPSFVSSNARKADVLLIPRHDWRMLTFATGLACLLLLGTTGGRMRRRIALIFGLASIISYSIGCGGGGGGGNGGGGGGGGGGTSPVPTKIALSSSNSKLPQYQPLTFVATVTSTETLSGSVTFYNYGAQVGGSVPLVNGQAQLVQGFFGSVGLYQVTATYSGDANNLSSSSAALTQVITGTVPTTVFGSSDGETHALQVSIGVQ